AGRQSTGEKWRLKVWPQSQVLGPSPALGVRSQFVSLSSHFSSSFDGPHSFYNAFSVVINLVVHINASTDVVGDNAKLFSHAWLMGRQAQVQVTMLLGHGYEFYLGMLGNIAKAGFVAGNQPIAGKRF